MEKPWEHRYELTSRCLPPTTAIPVVQFNRQNFPKDLLRICATFSMRNESQKTSCDILTPLVELLLLDDPTRDDCVAKLMQREDCEFFLLFGTSFGRHLSISAFGWDSAVTVDRSRLTKQGQHMSANLDQMKTYNWRHSTTLDLCNWGIFKAMQCFDAHVTKNKMHSLRSSDLFHTNFTQL